MWSESGSKAETAADPKYVIGGVAVGLVFGIAVGVVLDSGDRERLQKAGSKRVERPASRTK